MRVLGVNPTANVGAVEALRLLYPLRQMELEGHQTAVVPAADLARMVADGKRPFQEADIVVLQRLTGESGDWRPFVIAARAAGASIVCDYDDDYTNEHRVVCAGGVPDLSAFSAITVSTPHLKGVMQRYNKHVFVLPNLLVPEVINRPFKREIEGLSIGLTGSTTHVGDWDVVVDPLHRIAAEFPEVKVFCTGYVPEGLRDLPNLVTLRTLGYAQEMQTDDFYVPLADYGYILRNIDVLLAPVDPWDRFNWSKSNIKCTEGQCSARPVGEGIGGCSVIATGDIPNYKDCIQDGLTGMLVPHHDQNAWYRALHRNITDVAFRHNVQKAGHESCLKHFNIHTRIGGRVAAYNRIRELDRRQRPRLQAKLADMATQMAPA
jgi:hypothetical protein